MDILWINTKRPVEAKLKMKFLKLEAVALPYPVEKGGIIYTEIKTFQKGKKGWDGAFEKFLLLNGMKSNKKPKKTVSAAKKAVKSVKRKNK